MDKQTESLAIENLRLHYGKIIKWLIIGWAVSLIAMAAINMIAWCQYDYTSTKTESVVTIDGKNGTANYIGNDGDIVNGENNRNKNNDNKNAP